MPARRRPYNPGKPALCDLCEVRFYSLKIHKRVFHSGGEEVKCVFCGVPFLNISALKKHLNVHTDAAEVYCCICLTTFDSTESLSSHLETHVELHLFFCSECKWTFQSRKRLVSHDCMALMISPTHLLEVSAKAEKDLRVEGKPGPQDAGGDCLPIDLVSTVGAHEKSAISELAPTPKVHVLKSLPIIEGKRRCTFSASTVNEIKIYHAKDLLSSSAKVNPHGLLNLPTLPGSMQSAGDGTQIPYSTPITSISREETTPSVTSKSNETPNCESESVVFEEKAPVARNECSLLKTLPDECSTDPKENGFHFPPKENCQPNFQDGAEKFLSGIKYPVVINADGKDEANAPESMNHTSAMSGDLSHTATVPSVTEVGVAKHQIAIQKLENSGISTTLVEVDEEAPTKELVNSLAVVPKETPNSLATTKAYSDEQTSSKSTSILEVEKILDSDSSYKENLVNPVLLQNMVEKASDFVVKPDRPHGEGKEEMTDLVLACAPAVHKKESCKLSSVESAQSMADAEELPAYITRRKHRMHLITVGQDSSKNTLISVSNQSLSKPLMKEGLLSSQNPVAPIFHEVDAPEGVPDCLNEPDLIEDNSSMIGSKNIALPSVVPLNRQVDTVSNEEELPKWISLLRPRRRATITYGKTHKIPKCNKTDSKISVAIEEKKEDVPGSVSLNKNVTSQGVADHNFSGAPSCTVLVPSLKQEDVGSDGDELPNCILRQRPRHRATTACGKILKLSKTELENIFIPVEDKSIPDPVSLNDIVTSQLQVNNSIKAVADQAVSDVPSCMMLECSKQVPEFQMDVEIVVEKSAGVVLHDHILRPRCQTRWPTTAQENSTKCKKFRCGNHSINVQGRGTNRELHGLTSLENQATSLLNDDITKELTVVTEVTECNLIKQEAKPISNSEIKGISVTFLNQEHPQQFLEHDNNKALETSVCSALGRQLRKTRRLTTVHRMPPAKKTPKPPVKGQHFDNACRPNLLLSSSVARQASESGIAGSVVGDTENTSDAIKEGSVATLDSDCNLQQHPQQLLQEAGAVAAPSGAETGPTIFTSRGRKVIGRSTTIIIGKPVMKETNEISEGTQSLSNSQYVFSLQNGLEKETGEIVFENRVALLAKESNEPRRTENTINAPHDHTKAACKCDCSKQPSKQEAGESDEPKAAAVTVPPATCETDCSKQPSKQEAGESDEPKAAAVTVPPFTCKSDCSKQPSKQEERKSDEPKAAAVTVPPFTCKSDCSKQPSKQEERKSDEPKAAAVPPAFSRRGRRTLRLTTVPEVSTSNQNSESTTFPKGNVNLEDPSTRLHDVGRVADCSKTANPLLIAENESLPVEESKVLPHPPPFGQDKEPPGPIHKAAPNPIAAEDTSPIPKRQLRKTRRLTTVHEDGQQQTRTKKLNDTLTLVDIVNKASRRSVRKRRLSQKVGNEDENISPSSQVVPGPNCPISSKKKKISFNETIECWNPILQEMTTWRGLCDEIREVPLLKPVPKSKRAKQSNDRKKKPRKSSQSIIRVSSANEESQEFVEIVGICVPTRLKAPHNLRPVLKPSPVPDVPSTNEKEKPEIGTPKRKYAQRKLVLKNMKQLVEKYGANFSYKGCLKVDGRYHCPDEDCMDNDHRGYNTEKVIRNHIKTNHLDVDCPTCDVCGKSFATYSRLREHKIIHSNELPYPCKNCDKSFKTAALLKQHAGTHTPFGKCFYCSKSFSTKRILENHFRDAPCRCDSCNVVLGCPALFAKHEEEIAHQHKCPTCSRSYQTLPTFMRHIRDVHYDKTTLYDGRYQCRSCDRKFTRWKNIWRHVRRNHPVNDIVKSAINF